LEAGSVRLAVAAFARRCALRRDIAEAVRPLLEAAARAVTPAPTMTEAVLPAAAFLAVLTFALYNIADVRLRLTAAAGDKGRKCVYVLRRRPVAVLIRLLLRVRLTRLLMLLWTRLMLIARGKGLRIAGDEGLRLRLRLLMVLRHLRLRREARFVLHRERLTIIVVVEIVVGGALRLLPTLRLLVLLIVSLIRILLPELFLRSGNQAEVMFGVLVIVFRRDRIAGALRVARELDIFFRDRRSRAANFDVRSVRFVDPRQRVLAFAVLIIVVVIAVVIIVVVTSAHALLTVSHDVPFRRPFASLAVALVAVAFAPIQKSQVRTKSMRGRTWLCPAWA
jgi:hypothetical protein